MQRPKSWKGILAEILSEHNDRHGKRNKDVSHVTREQRGQRIFRCFRQLRELGYKLEDPRNIGNRHIQALVDYWVSRNLSPATIQTWLSHLRVFCGWIGKAGMVEKPERYVSDPEYVKRHYAADRDKTWTGNNVDLEATILKVAAIDRHVADQLLAELLFGLRVKEAIMLKPWRAHQGDALLVVDGTKGGRPRIVPIDHQAQRDALLAFKQSRRSKNASLSDPSLKLHQAINRYYSVMRAAGITKKKLGVTSHGLRNEFGNALYADLAGVASPVQGGPRIDRELDRMARREVAEQLGHSREQISCAYIGPILRAIKKSGRTAVGQPA